jgi:hypothetical protein
MIKLTAIGFAGPAELDLAFNDGTTGRWSASEIIARDTVLTRALGDADYFRRAFIEAGALAWPNGLELSASSLHQKLEGAGLLRRRAA